MKKTMIGAYGAWAAGLRPSPALLSFRRGEFVSIEAWRKKAVAKTLELMAAPAMPAAPRARVERAFEFDGLYMEELSWQLSCGPRTSAIFMKPIGAKGKLPGMLALHDHGGKKFFGWQKIANASRAVHPTLRAKPAYGGRAWANEIARRGYAVLVHDVFPFGSRRIRLDEVPETIGGRPEPKRATVKAVTDYNEFTWRHEHIIAKSLFCAGTSWVGMAFAEDSAALGYLASRADVDASRVACCGLSGGGQRTVYLAGLDRRVKAAVTVGFMTTWDDFLLNHANCHTWMIYTPRLPNYLEFPEVYGLRAPLPSLVISARQDPIFTLSEMRKADRLLKEVYAKAGSPENYRTLFYSGGHRFDVQMQEAAFDWLDRHLVNG